MSEAFGTVVEVHGMRATVLIHASGRTLRCRPLRDRTPLAVGDRVHVSETSDGGEILVLDPRSRTLWRPEERGRRPMASQVDRVLVIGAVVPELRPGLVDRFLVGADAEDIDVLLVLNKTDLVPRDCLPDLEREIQARNPGVPVVAAVHCDIDLRLLYSGRSTAGALRAHHAHPGHDQFESVEIAVPPGLDPDQVERLVRAQRAWRVKGFVRIDGDPWVVQGVGRRLEIVPARGGVDPALLGRLVLIRRVAGAAVGVTG